MSSNETLATRCCIVGGGPAGVMLGFLLARAGVEVVVLEKHADFFRDFRGDTIHPSTLELMHELGLLDEFLRLPHQEVSRLDAWIEENRASIVDFSHLPTHCKFIALMPQWDFLNFIVDRARKYPTFQLRLSTEATDLLRDGNRVTGVTAKTPDGTLTVNSDLVVAADGRGSIIRQRANLEVLDRGAPMDVLWMRVSTGSDGPAHTLGRVRSGHILVMIYRGDYWQLGFVIPKGGIDELRRRGLPELRGEILRSAPFLGDRVEELRSWDDIRLLTVRVDRLHKWHLPGLLCIGDSAHAMSPIGGVGVNLAVQDAVAAANILVGPLSRGAVDENVLAAVQRRREWPTRVTQGIQVFMQKRIIHRVLTSEKPYTKLPWILRLMQRFPVLQRVPARLLGLGVRPEHVRTPEIAGRD